MGKLEIGQVPHKNSDSFRAICRNPVPRMDREALRHGVMAGAPGEVLHDLSTSDRRVAVFGGILKPVSCVEGLLWGCKCYATLSHKFLQLCRARWSSSWSMAD